MPNWCYQKLRVQGKPEDLARFKEACLPEGIFELDRVIPMPRELDIQEGSAGNTGYQALYGNWSEVLASMARNTDIPTEARLSRESFAAWLETVDPEAVSLGRQYKANIERHGHRSWYTWRIEHWGTKWEIGSDQQSICEDSETSLFLQFETAWSPIHPVVQKIACRHPDLSFDLWYLDEGGSFSGRSSLQGCEYSDEDLEWRQLAEEQFGWDFADEDDDEEVAA